VRLETLSKLKESTDLIRIRTRDLPVCSIVPQPTSLPRAPEPGNVQLNISLSGAYVCLFCQAVILLFTYGHYGGKVKDQVSSVTEDKEHFRTESEPGHRLRSDVTCLLSPRYFL
jgi:hypothetical protein